MSGMLAASGKGGTIVEDTIRQKSVSDIAVQTTTEEGLVPLPVSDKQLLTFNLWLLLQDGWEVCTASNRCVFYVDHSEYRSVYDFHV